MVTEEALSVEQWVTITVSSGELTSQLVPQLVDAFGIGADSAAEMFIVAGDNIVRVHSERAWARLLCRADPRLV